MLENQTEWQSARHRCSPMSFVLCVLMAAAIGCSSSSGPTYLQFVIDGQQYELHDAEFAVVDLADGARFIDFGDAFAVPGAVFQWTTSFASIDELAGRELSFNEPGFSVLFNPIEDVGAYPDEGSSGSLRISKIEDGLVVGSFSGKNLLYVSMTESTRRVDVTGLFRARLVR